MNRQTMTGFAVMIGALCFIVGLAGCGGGSDAVRQAQWVDFTMGWDAETQTMSVLDQVGPAYVEAGGVRLDSSNVVWNSGTKTLTGDVTVTNNTGGIMWGTVATTVSCVPSDQNITEDSWWGYGKLFPDAISNPETWTFTNPNAVSFTFTVRIYWDS